MIWKGLLKTILLPILAVGYSTLKGHYPDFPLDSDNFVAVILWGIGFGIGGWQAKKAHIQAKIQRLGYFKLDKQIITPKERF